MRQIFNDGAFVIVKDDNRDEYSFGTLYELDSFYGFPAEQSCLTKEQAIETLRRLTGIYKPFGNANRWETMIASIV